MKNDFDKGFICDGCGSFVKRYTRSFNSNMAIALILIHKSGITDFMKVEDFLIKSGRKRCGDFSYLVHYGFLEKQQDVREDGSSRTGYYRITKAGVSFALGLKTAPEKFMILHGKVEGFTGDNISIREALGKKFNYDELMSVPKPKKTKTSSAPLEKPLFS